MFTLKAAYDVPGQKPPYRVGFPDHTQVNICLLSNYDYMVYSPLNAHVLRTALLNSPKVVEQMLGLKIIDLKAIRETPKVEVLIQEGPQKRGPKPKKATAPPPPKKKKEEEEKENE